MKISIAPNQLCFIFACLAFVGVTWSADCGQAQILNKLRSDYDTDSMIQYAPDDPATRSRLFNLQTGHAGAFYNCDGEECKRNSPYICWKTGQDDKLHCTFWDVLQWRTDRDRIAQRICDGAGACCNGGSCGSNVGASVVETAAPCGCASCIAAAKREQAGRSKMAVAANKRSAGSERKVSRTNYANASAQKSGLLRPRVNVAGLVDSPLAKQSSTVASAINQQSVAVAKKKACDCAECRAMRKASVQSATPTTVGTKPTAGTRSASLLDRARASRTQR
ncbi:hypothetical protein [Mariniblastus fucicola]|nr:hypothetical protein [Mariniblastus fucicola]